MTILNHSFTLNFLLVVSHSNVIATKFLWQILLVNLLRYQTEYELFRNEEKVDLPCFRWIWPFLQKITFKFIHSFVASVEAGHMQKKAIFIVLLGVQQKEWSLCHPADRHGYHNKIIWRETAFMSDSSDEYAPLNLLKSIILSRSISSSFSEDSISRFGYRFLRHSVGCRS